MNLKSNRAITLVALIITIIILLILAGVSLSMILGDNGLINKAQSSVNAYQDAAQKEQLLLNSMEDYMNKILLGLPDDKPAIIEAKQDKVSVVEGTNSNIESYFNIYQNGSSIIKEIKYKNMNDGSEIKNTNELMTGVYIIECSVVKENGMLATKQIEVRIKLEYAKQNMIIHTEEANLQMVLPKDFAIGIIDNNTKKVTELRDLNGIVLSAEEIKNGVVTLDKLANEFVWIPVKQNSDLKRFDEIDKSVYIETMPTNIINSINNNKGFYIGRYELGMNRVRQYGDSINEVKEIKQGLYAYNFVTWEQARDVAATFNTTLNSHLMYGTEYDTVLQWIINTDNGVGLYEVKTDSKSWGNYVDSIFQYTGRATTSGEYTGSPTVYTELQENKTKLSGENQILTCGSSIQNCINNIFDFAGNGWKWTMEGVNDGVNGKVARGGITNAAFRGWTKPDACSVYRFIRIALCL